MFQKAPEIPKQAAQPPETAQLKETPPVETYKADLTGNLEKDAKEYAKLAYPGKPESLNNYQYTLKKYQDAFGQAVSKKMRDTIFPTDSPVTPEEQKHFWQALNQIGCKNITVNHKENEIVITFEPAINENRLSELKNRYQEISKNEYLKEHMQTTEKSRNEIADLRQKFPKPPSPKPPEKA